MKRFITLALLALAVHAAGQKIAHGVNLAWSWTGTGTATYNIYRATVSGGETKPALASGVATSTYSDTTAVVGQQYYYTVTAVVGGVESAPSTEVGALISVPPSPTSPSTTVY
jgi:fibronectin type 3 domain-containing protein